MDKEKQQEESNSDQNSDASSGKEVSDFFHFPREVEDFLYPDQYNLVAHYRLLVHFS